MNEFGYIYKIRNTINNDYYVGRSLNPKRREYTHFWKLKNGIHTNKILQNAYNKYGRDIFVFEIIQKVDIKDIISIEQYYLSFFKGKYNISDSSYSPMAIGSHHRPETKRKISEFHKGKKWGLGRIVSEESRIKSRNSHKLLDTPERRKMMSEIQIGRQAGSKNPRAKKVIDLKTGKIYDCAKYVLMDYDINYITLIRKLLGKRKKPSQFMYVAS